MQPEEPPGASAEILTLSGPEALVLFEFLSRYVDDKAALSVQHLAEDVVLWSLLAQLQRVLVEPFRPDYDELLSVARAVVADGYSNS